MFYRVILSIFILSISLFSEQRASFIEQKEVIKAEINSLKKFIGTLYFSRVSNVASQSSGKVIKINFEAGDRVKKGDILAELDSEALDSSIVSAKASIKEVEADFKLSKREFERFKSLLKSSAVTESEYDLKYYTMQSLEAKVNSLEAKLKELYVAKSKKVIKAPFDGVVIEKSTELGNWLNSGGEVLTLANLESIDAIFNIPEEFIDSISTQKELPIEIGDRIYQAKLYGAILKGDLRSRTFPLKFKVELDSKVIYEGMEAILNFKTKDRVKSLLVPRDAVIKRFGGDIVFANVDGKAQMMSVEIVGYKEGYIAVKSPKLKEGMSVVTKGNERIFPNQPIQPIK